MSPIHDDYLVKWAIALWRVCMQVVMEYVEQYNEDDKTDVDGVLMQCRYRYDATRHASVGRIRRFALHPRKCALFNWR